MGLNSISSAHAYKDNPGRLWQLTADAPGEAVLWAGVLTDALSASKSAPSLSVTLPSKAPSTPSTVLSTDAAGTEQSNELRTSVPDEEETVATDESEEHVGATGLWLVKAADGVGRERRRWFDLQRGKSSRILRLTYYADVKGGVGVDRKGSIVISNGESIGQEGALLTIVRLAE